MPVSRADLLMVRQAIREGWPVPEAVRLAVIDDVCDVALAGDPRRAIAAVRVILAMEDDNQHAEQRWASEQWPAHAPR